MDNLIRRKDTLDALMEALSEKEYSNDPGLNRYDIHCVINSMPSAPTGEWIYDEESSQNHVEKIYICSNCKNWEAWGETERTRYCPYCGAKMKNHIYGNIRGKKE